MRACVHAPVLVKGANRRVHYAGMKCVWKQPPSSASWLRTCVLAIMPRISLTLNSNIVASVDQLRGLSPESVLAIPGASDPCRSNTPSASVAQTAAPPPLLPVGLTWSRRGGVQAGLL